MHPLADKLKKFLKVECEGLLFEEKKYNEYFNFIGYIQEKEKNREFSAEDAMRLFSAPYEDLENVNFSEFISMTGEINATSLVVYPKKTITKGAFVLPQYEEKIKDFFLRTERFFPSEGFMGNSEFILYNNRKVQNKKLKWKHFPKVHFPTLKKDITSTEFFRIAKPEKLSFILTDDFEKGRDIIHTMMVRPHVHK